MLKSIHTLFCLLSVAFAISDFSDLYLCPSVPDGDQFPSERPKFCLPVCSTGQSLGEASQNRMKRSLEELPETWSLVRTNRGGHETIQTIHLPSSFTPRLGRRGIGGRMVTDPNQQVINLNAGTAFTPRLGRRASSPLN